MTGTQKAQLLEQLRNDVDKQKLTIRDMELRWGDEGPTQDEREKMLGAVGDLKKVHTRIDETLAIEIEPDPPMAEEDSETREINELYHRALLTNYVRNAYQGKDHDGAEAEFMSAIFGDNKPSNRLAGQTFPIHMLLPYGEDLEVRQDTATTVSADRGVVITRPILERLFARTDAEYMGAQFLSVPPGEQRYPYIASGATLTYATEGTMVDAAAGTVEVETSQPISGRLAYLIAHESLMRFPNGELEGRFRADARMAITDGMDNAIIRGVTSPAISGLESLTAGTDATATISLSELMSIFAGRVDGRVANTWQDPRLLLRSEPYATLAMTLPAASNEGIASALTDPSRLRATQRLTAPVSNLSQAISYAPVGNRGDLLVPIWQDVMVIPDTITRAGAGQVKTTMSVMHNVRILRSDAWMRHSLKDN